MAILKEMNQFSEEFGAIGVQSRVGSSAIDFAPRCLVDLDTGDMLQRLLSTMG